MSAAVPECGKPSRQWGGAVPCLLDEGHRGYHSISVFICDQCGHRRRNPPAAFAPDDASGETLMAFCFPCTGPRSGWAP